jgi:hypothetical protein
LTLIVFSLKEALQIPKPKRVPLSFFCKFDLINSQHPLVPLGYH